MAYPISRRLLTWIPEHYVVSDVQGLEHIPAGPCVIAANHINAVDGYVIGGVLIRHLHRHVSTFSNLPRHWGRVLEMIGKYWSRVIYVRPEQKSEAVEKARRVLRLGSIVLVFIEGQVSLDPERLHKGKTGAARLALLERVPVIPAAITRGPHLKGVRKTLQMLRRTHVKERLEFGPPMDFSAYFDRPITYELLQEVTRKMMFKLSEMTGQKYDS